MRGIGISTVKARSRSWLAGAQSGTMCFFKAGWTDVVEYNVESGFVEATCQQLLYYTKCRMFLAWFLLLFCCFLYMAKQKPTPYLY